MSDYQSLGTYEGTLYGKPNYNDYPIEYDWEVPDNMVVGSPGGVSTIHHHYTKGFNGRGNSSSDVYAGQGERYNAGVYGNLYEVGHGGGQGAGYYSAAPDYQYWQNQPPSTDDYRVDQASMTKFQQVPVDPPTPSMFPPGTSAQGFGDAHSDWDEPSGQIETFETPIDDDGTAFVVPTTNVWVILAVGMLALIASWFISKSLYAAMREKSGGDRVGWKPLAVVGLGMVIVIACVIVFGRS